MASTALTGTILDVTGTCLAGARRMACGRGICSGGAATVVTGLNTVDIMLVNGISAADVVYVNQDLPDANGTVTLAGGTSEEFQWIAIGS